MVAGNKIERSPHTHGYGHTPSTHMHADKLFLLGGSQRDKQDIRMSGFQSLEDIAMIHDKQGGVRRRIRAGHLQARVARLEDFHCCLGHTLCAPQAIQPESFLRGAFRQHRRQVGAGYTALEFRPEERRELNNRESVG